MAAALKGGNVFAEGHGLEKAADDGEAEEADDESAGSPAANVAPQRPGRLEKVAEKLAEAARSRDGPAENGAAAEVANGGQMEGTPAADTAEQPDQAAKPVKAAAKEEPAGREADAMPPWFSRKTTAAVETVKRPVEHTHGAGRHSTRRARHSNSVEDTWLQVHQRYLKEAKEADSHGGWDVLFYGDSIVEEWRGTFLGAPWGPFHDVRKVWDEFFGRKPYTAHSMGIASDGVEQLAWRLQHGELPVDRDRQPKVIIVHVGTNDIVGECTNELGAKVASGIEDILTDLHSQLPATHIIIMAILPKGEVWPNRCSGAINTANEALQSLAQSRSNHLHYLDAGQAFLSESLDKNKFEIKETLMPDSMHPSAVGMRIIATRLEPLVSRLVATPLETGPESERR
ncbi:hypothetical protein WJX75_001192 [Coccomyxa subellipsoidea]|uniref:SGNH hydrolase-type esterase domain-containing protein n=1 Tax=Coccomyxa subellipsoidea TaxID=248742 RepID=A0ABR2YN31_9CHLO